MHQTAAILPTVNVYDVDEDFNLPRPSMADPEDRTKAMSSPAVQWGQSFIVRREMIELVSANDLSKCVQPIGLNVSSLHSKTENKPPAGTFLLKKVPFPYSATRQYPHKQLTFGSFRIILTDVITHYRKGQTHAEFQFSLYACLTRSSSGISCTDGRSRLLQPSTTTRTAR